MLLEKFSLCIQSKHIWKFYKIFQGDSGGPLTYKDSDGKEAVRGIVSFGHVGGCTNGYPDGFTRVTHYIQWIKDKMAMY